MEHETIFDIGDVVWFMHNDEVCNGRIKSIRYIKFISPVDYRTIENEMYSIENIGVMFDSCKLFKAKEDLIKSL